MKMNTKGYSYHIAGKAADRVFCETGIVSEDTAEIKIENAGLVIQRTIRAYRDGLSETVSVSNTGKDRIVLDEFKLGYLFPLKEKTLYAIPFTIQQDGQRHIYSAEVLRNGTQVQYVNNDSPKSDGPQFGNSVYSDPSRPEPELTESGQLRSEAWYWGNEDEGILIAKYNNTCIENSVAEPCGKEREYLRLGGAGFSLYHEPSEAGEIEPGASFTFGITYYLPATDLAQACGRYKEILNENGHGLPADYEPKVHWNELYDVGWLHSDRQLLNQWYTLDALKREAGKARKCSCDALYLDPGWEFAEGLTFFDHHRLGEEKEFAAMLKEEYGLELSIRTILRTYINYWPSELNVLHDPDGIATASMTPKTIIPANQLLYEQCLCNPKFFNEKKKRIEKLVEDGATFLMMDEMDWRGECFHSGHGHSVPAKAVDHANAVCDLAKHIKNKYHITVEVHDPIWPWNSAVYTPVYWRQGFGEDGSYQENWGFEFMWDCINDIKTGRALSLYYYNLSCDIPLYLHINMSADNDNCLFFWWAASTIRHLGIGGANCHPSVVPPGKTFSFDPETRFNSYADCMATYKKLKAYYQRGRFVGVDEYAHLHILPEKSGGVLDLFNCRDEAQSIEVRIPVEDLKGVVQAQGATVETEKDFCVVRAEVPALSHRLVLFGDAIKDAE